jgi:hypothetical protein
MLRDRPIMAARSHLLWRVGRTGNRTVLIATAAALIWYDVGDQSHVARRVRIFL